MRYLLFLLIIGGVIFLVVRMFSRMAIGKQSRPASDRATRIAELEYQLKKAEHDMMTYKLRGQGLCPHCEAHVEKSAIKCENCDERFWMTQDEAIRSKEAGRARIEKLTEMLATIR